MRIIAGIAKGRSLSSVAGATRPTSDRAREAIFSTLTSEFGDFLGLHILDLFAGSGAMGLEALSRGASLVHCVEKDDAAAKTISTNSALVQKSQPVGVFHLFHMAVQKFVEGSPENKYHFVYIDPPYEVDNVEVEKILKKILALGLLSKFGLVAIERDAKAKSFTWPDGFSELKVRSYGAGAIHYGVLTERIG